MNEQLLVQLPEEIINKIYKHFFSRVIINGLEFNTKLFQTQLKQLSFKQRRNMLQYHNHPTI